MLLYSSNIQIFGELLPFQIKLSQGHSLLSEPSLNPQNFASSYPESSSPLKIFSFESPYFPYRASKSWFSLSQFLQIFISLILINLSH